jgi:regulator of protease activity HflC (stomatin/prohibitin superfamily)
MKSKLTALRASASKLAIATRDKIAQWWNSFSTFVKDTWQKGDLWKRTVLWFKNLKGTKMKINGMTIFGGTVGVAAAGAVVVALATEPLIIFGQELSFTWLWIWASTAYIGFSFRWKKPIGPDQLAVRTMFGYPTDVLGPGLPFVPLGLFEIQTLPGTIIQREFPAEPDMVYHGDGDMPSGMKPPIRIPFGDSIKDVAAARSIFGKDFEVIDAHKIYGIDWSSQTYGELDQLEADERKKPKDERKLIAFKSQVAKDDGISRRVTGNVVPYAAWQIESATDFVQNVAPLETPETRDFEVTEKLIAEVNKRIEDEMVSVLTRLLQKMSLAQALNNTDWINAHLYFSVIKRTLGWGIKVDRATVKLFGTPKRINEAIANAAAAEFQGKADKKLLIAQGEGTAQAARDLEEQTLRGRADGLKALMDETSLSGEQVQAAEVARAIAEGGNAIIFGADGLAQAASVVSAMVNKKPAPDKNGG